MLNKNIYAAFLSITKSVLITCACIQFCVLDVPAMMAATTDATTPIPVNLDLTSTQKTATAPASATGVNIMVGGQSVQIAPSTAITAAELMAVQQVLSTGQQTLMLSAQGAATGGAFSLASILNAQIANLLIPHGVTALQVFNTSNVLNLTGNLTNSGTLTTSSSNSQINSAIISASNIYNMQGAFINSNINLTLQAVHDIVNSGTISSSRSLSLIAGGSIINALPTGAIGPSPIIQALNNLNLQASNIINSGILASRAADINISQILDTLTINNMSGQVLAPAGSINIGSTALNKLISNGGDFIAKQINMISGGSVDFSADTISGVVDITGKSAVITALQSDLSLGTLCLSGDPTFATGGNLAISNNLIFPGQSLALIAGKNITTTVNNLVISTASTTASGGNIVMVAGTNFSPSGSSFVLGGPSASGGNIDFATQPVRFVMSLSALAGGNGGNLTMVAYKGTAVGSTTGSISMPTAGTTPFGVFTGGRDVITGGLVTTAATNGNVSMIAGASSGTSIVSGPINAGSGSGGGGKVNLIAALPVLTGAGIVDATGALNGKFSWIVPQGNATVQIGPVSAAGALTVAAGNIELPPSDSITLQSLTPATNNVALLAERQITAAGPASRIQSNGGNATLVAGASFSNDPITDTITVTGGSAAGGEIDLGNASFVSTNFIPPAVGVSGSGGDITMVAFSGSSGSGRITTPLGIGSGRGLFTGGTGIGSNGDITLIAGAPSGTALTTGQINTSGGSGSGGNVNMSTANPESCFPCVQLQDAGIISGAFSWSVPNANATASIGTINSASSLTVGAGSIQLSGLGGVGGYQGLFLGPTALIASRDITAAPLMSIETDGSSILMIAGADFTHSGNTITVTSGSATGGLIDLTALNALSSAKVSTTGAGGDITLAAFAGSGLNSGSITTPIGIAPIGVFSGGNGSGSGNGNITMIAGSSVTTGLLEAVSDLSATGGGGNINIATAMPTTGLGGLTVSNGLSTGSLDWTTVNSTGAASLGPINTANSLTVAAGSIALTNGIQLSTNQSGVVLLSSTNITGDSNSFIQTGGHQLLIVAGAAIANGPGGIVVNGPSATGGSIDLSATSFLSSVGFAAGQNGGAIDLVAYNNIANPLSGTIQTPSGVGPGLGVFSGGNGTGSNGNVTIIASGNVTTGQINTAGGSGGGGGGNVNIATALTPTGNVTVNDGAIVSGALSWSNPSLSAVASIGTVNTAGSLTVAAGNIILGGLGIFLSSPLALIASQNITANPGINVETNGSTILMAAGSSFSNSGNTITINSGGSVSGGFIDLSAMSALSSAKVTAIGNGGDIVLVAYPGAGLNAGKVTLPLGTGTLLNPIGVFLGGKGSGSANGNLTIIAGSDLTAGLIEGIHDPLATGSGGNINLATAVPVTAPGGVFITNGVVTGTFSWISPVPSATTLLETINTASSLTVVAGNLILNGGLILNSAGTNNLSLLATGNITGSAGSFLQSNGGNILLIAGANLNNTNPLGTTNTGASSTGGSIDLSNSTFLSSVGLATDTNGGSISLFAYPANPGTGLIVTPSGTGAGLGIFSGGNGTGSNGKVTIVGGNDVTTGQINTAGGSGGGGHVNIVTALTPTGTVIVSNGTIIVGGLSWTNPHLTAVATIGTVNTADSLTVAAGNILLNGSGIFMESPLALIASQNITTNPGINVLTNGGNMFMVSGASFSNSSNIIMMNAVGSASGGQIDLSAASAISSARVSSPGNGGNITLVSFRGSSLNSGDVTTPTGIGTLSTPIGIFAGSSGSGFANGNLTIIAGSDVTTGFVGVISDLLAVGTGGNVNIATASPTTIGGVSVTNGNLSGTYTWSAPNVTNMASIGTINTAGTVSVAAGNILLTGVGAPAGQKGVLLTNPAFTNNLALISSNGIGANSDVAVQTNGGDILMVVGAAFANSGNIISITGGNSVGGSLNLSNCPFVSSAALGPNSNGGNVNLIAYLGSIGGTISTPSGSSGSGLYTGGTGSGSNGNVNIIAGGSAGTPISLGLIDTGTATGGGGDLLIAGATPVLPVGPVMVQNGGMIGPTYFSWTATQPAATASVGTVNRANNMLVAAGAIVLTGEGGVPGATGLFVDGSMKLLSNTNISVALCGTCSTLTGIQTNGGTMLVSAGSNIANNPLTSTVSTSGASSTGGSINLSNTEFLGTAPNGLGSGGAPVTLVAYRGSSATSGDIATPSILTAGANLAIIAGRNILALNTSALPGVPVGSTGFSISPPTVIQTNGGSAMLVAGALISAASVPAGTVNIVGTSASGGNIDLSNLYYLSSASASGNGGDITMVASQGSSSTGTITATSLFSGAGANLLSGVGLTNGNINIIASGTVSLTGNGPSGLNPPNPPTDVAINSGTAPGAGGGFVHIAAATPIITGGSTTVNPNGTVSGGPYTWTTPTNANITLGTVQFACCLVVTTGDSIVLTGNLILNNPNPPAPNLVALVAGKNITAIAATPLTTFIQTSGGPVLIVSGANFSNSVAGVAITGGTTSGGSTDLSSMVYISSAVVNPLLVNGNGGNLTFVSYAGTQSGSGVIQLPLTPDHDLPTGIFSGGAGSGTNGNITIIAGGTSGTTISVGDVNTMGGEGGGGNVLIATATPIPPAGSVVITDACQIVGQFTSGTLQAQAEATVGHVCASGQVTYEVGTLNGGSTTSGGNIIIISPNNIDIDTDKITTNGFITITSTAGDVTVENGILISGSLDVTITAFDDVNIGNGPNSGMNPVQISAGTLSTQGAINVNKIFAPSGPPTASSVLHPSDFATSGTLTIHAINGNLDVLKSTEFQSAGGDVKLLAGRAITIAQANDITEGVHVLALGGYIQVNAGLVNLTGTLITIHKNCCWASIGEFISPSTFVGGGIGIFAGVPLTPIAVQLAAHRGGNAIINGGVSGSPTLQNPNQGYIEIVGASNLQVVSSTLFDADGGAIIINSTGGNVHIDGEAKFFAVTQPGSQPNLIHPTTLAEIRECQFEIILPPCPPAPPFVGPQPLPPLLTTLLSVSPAQPPLPILPERLLQPPNPAQPPAPEQPISGPGAPPPPPFNPPMPPAELPQPQINPLGSPFTPPELPPTTIPPPPQAEINPLVPPVPPVPPTPPTPPVTPESISSLPAVLPALTPPIPLKFGEFTQAQTTCQGMYPEWDNDTYLQANPGTKLAVAEHDKTLKLASGQLLASAGKAGLRIDTAVSAVFLDPYAVALIETTSGDKPVTHVTVLDTPEDGGVVVRGPDSAAGTGPQFFVLHAEEQALIAKQPLANTLKGTASKPARRGEYFVLQAHADLDDAFRRNMILACRYERIGPPSYPRAQQATTGLAGRAPLGASAPGNRKIQLVLRSDLPGCNCPDNKGPVPAIGNSTEWQPVSLRTPLATIPPSASPVAQATGQLMTEGTEMVEVAESQLRLNRGSVLLYAEKDVSVTTKFATAYLRRGAAAIVSANQRDTRVLNLYDKAAGGVRVLFNKSFISLQPGNEVDVVSGDVQAGQRLIAQQELSHRRMRFLEPNKGVCIVLSEFSLVDALVRHPLLQLLRSSASKSDLKLVNILMKTTASIAISSNAHKGPYYSSSAGVAVAKK